MAKDSGRGTQSRSLLANIKAVRTLRGVAEKILLPIIADSASKPGWGPNQNFLAHWPGLWREGLVSAINLTIYSSPQVRVIGLPGLIYGTDLFSVDPRDLV